MYNFTVVAFDPLGEKKEARQTVEIFVIDENDHAPKFDIENERIEISEVWFFFYLSYYSRLCIYNSVHLKFQRMCKLFETYLNYFPSQKYFSEHQIRKCDLPRSNWRRRHSGIQPALSVRVGRLCWRHFQLRHSICDLPNRPNIGNYLRCRTAGLRNAAALQSDDSSQEPRRRAHFD